MTTRVKDAQGAYAFEELKASVGKSTLAGSGAVSVGAPRPKVRAQLTSPLLDLSELFPADGRAQAKPAAAPTPAGPSKERRMFTADPLPLESLKAADADLDVKIDRLLLPNKMPIEALVVRLVLAAGDSTSSRSAAGWGAALSAAAWRWMPPRERRPLWRPRSMRRASISAR